MTVMINGRSLFVALTLTSFVVVTRACSLQYSCDDGNICEQVVNYIDCEVSSSSDIFSGAIGVCNKMVEKLFTCNDRVVTTCSGDYLTSYVKCHVVPVEVKQEQDVGNLLSFLLSFFKDNFMLFSVSIFVLFCIACVLTCVLTCLEKACNVGENVYRRL